MLIHELGISAHIIKIHPSDVDADIKEETDAEYGAVILGSFIGSKAS